MDRCVWGDSPRASTGGSLRKRSRPSSDSMELRDRTAMILGGSGLVGHAVARRLLAAAPRRIVLVALFEEEVKATAEALEPYRGRAAIELVWGNVFRAGALRRAETKAYVKVRTSGTGGMGFNIPYTHSEERPSRTLLAKSAVAGAQSLLLFLLGRTPGLPATVEIKPTATIGWREIGFGPIRSKGKAIPLVDCPEPVPVSHAFRPDAQPWCDLGRPLEGVFIDVGENGLFARDEFETVTALGQMEFITPEEIAEYVLMELEGRPTGRDVVAALDAATAGPTYRAGVLRAHAIEQLRALERQTKSRSVAYEMLGPPRLTKLLWEAHLCALLRPSVRALARSNAQELATEAHALVTRDAALRSHILSVGIPILAPDGEAVYRGRQVVVADDGADPRAAAPRGWVDLRPEQFGMWVKRAREIVAQAERRPSRAAESGSGVDWTALAADDAIEPARFATWVFRYEDRGERIKR